MKLLFVDDDKTTVMVAKRHLLEKGFDVIVAYSGEEAIQVYLNSDPKPDVVLLDYIMPIVDGEKTLEEIKKINPNAIVLMMVQPFVQDEAMARLRLLSLKEKGVSGLLLKPVKMTAIEKKISELLPNI